VTAASTRPAGRPVLAAAGRNLRIGAESARMQVLLVRGHPMVPLSTIVQPAVFLVIFLGRPGPARPAERAVTVIAVLLTCMWGATLWAAGGTLRREVADGTLARNLTGVSDPRLVIGGKCLGSTLLVLGLLSCTAGVTAALTGIRLSPGGALLLIPGLVLVAASGTALGFLLCSVFVLTRHAVHVTAALMYPIFILGGLLIPIRLIPWPLAWLSHLISLYWINQFLDSAAAGTFNPRAAALALVLTAGYFWAGSLLFTRVIDRARRKGTIDLG
jgi:ABC-2 type transport system permease protein